VAANAADAAAAHAHNAPDAAAHATGAAVDAEQISTALTGSQLRLRKLDNDDVC